MTDPLTPAERNIAEAMDGHSEKEVAALIAIERVFAARLAAGEPGTEALCDEITGSAASHIGGKHGRQRGAGLRRAAQAAGLPRCIEPSQGPILGRLSPHLS